MARNGVAIKREQASAQKKKDGQITRFANALRDGTLTTYQFLEVCAQFFETAVLPIVLADEPPHPDKVNEKTAAQKPKKSQNFGYALSVFLK